MGASSRSREGRAVGSLTYQVPVPASEPNSTADPKISSALNAILAFANGGIDAVNLSAALAQSLGTNQSGQVTKGAVSIAASESRTNTAYGTMPTPDQVTGIVLPANGKLIVDYQATWQESVAGAARAAIFIGSNQLRALNSTQAAATGATSVTAANTPLATFPLGLLSVGTQGGGAYGGDATTGQAIGIAIPGFAGNPAFAELGGSVSVLAPGSGSSQANYWGGPCEIFAAAGTYTVALMFKASSGSVTASNRRLWVEAKSYG